MRTLPKVVNFPPPSREGDWWKDQILCGDSLDILRAMPAKSVHLAITSPPYNVGLNYDTHDDRKPYKEYL